MLLLALLACSGSKTSGPAADSPCGPDELWADGECVPESCGSTVFPAVDGIVAWVDASATEAGDGSETSPFTTIQAGTDLAGALGGGVVAVASGTYVENLALTNAHDGVLVVGRCKEMVTIDGGAPEEGATTTVLLEATSPDVGAGLARVSTWGGLRGPATVGGSLTLEDVDVGGGYYWGIFALGTQGVTASIVALDVSVHSPGGELGSALYATGDSSMEVDGLGVVGTGGTAGVELGVVALDGAELSVVDAVIDATGGYAAWADTQDAGTVTTLSLSNVSILASAPWSDQGLTYSAAVSAGYGMGSDHVTLRAVTIEDAAAMAVEVGPTAELEAEELDVVGVEEVDGMGWGLFVEGVAWVSDSSISDTVGLAVQEVSGSLTLSESTISASRANAEGVGGDGIQVLGGSFTATGLTIDDFDRIGLSVDGPSTSVTLTNSTIGGGRAASGSEDSRGIQLTGGAWLSASTLDVGDIVGSGVAVGGEKADGSASPGVASLVDCRIHDLTDPEIEAEGGARGIYVGRAGSSLTGSGVSIEDVAGIGLQVALDASAELSDLEILGTVPNALGVGGTGIQGGSGATLTIDGLSIRESTGAAVALDDASLSLTDADIRDTLANAEGEGGHALELQDATSWLDIEDSVLADNLDIAVQVVGGTVVAENVEIYGTTSVTTAGGIGVAIVGDGFGTFSDLDIHDNSGIGLGVQAGAQVSCTRCDLQDNGFSNLVLQGGSLHLEELGLGASVPESENGGGFGVFVDSATEFGAGELSVSACVIDAQVLAGIYLEGPGLYTITGCELAGGPGDGGASFPSGDAVFATGGIGPPNGKTGLSISDSTLHDSGTYALLLDGSGAYLSGNTWTGNTVDILQDRCDEAPEVAGADEASTVDLCPRDGYDVAITDFDYHNLPN